ncbi:MAG: M60 family metallopeptidase [Clostridiales bacterium]|nr:M60 family metallopeptidase [Clostridiales bacterium]
MPDPKNTKPPVKSAPAAKPAATKPTSTVTAKPTATTASKPAAATAKPAAKPAPAPARPAPTASRPTATTGAAKPAPTVKPVTPAAKSTPTATAKPTATAAAKPTATTNPTATAAAKPTATTKPTATAAAKPTATATTKPTAAPARSAPAATKPTTAQAAPATKPETPAAKPAPTATAKLAASTAAEKPTSKKVEPAAKPAPAKNEGKAKAAAIKRTEKKKESSATKVPKSKSKGEGGVIALIKENKVKAIISAAICFVVIIALIFGLVFGLKGCGSDGKVLHNQKASAINQYPAVSRVAFHSEQTTTAKRNKPVEGVHDEAEAFGSANGYPKYGSTLKAVIGTDEARVAARNALIDESTYLAAYGTRGANNDGKGNDEDKYTWMDKDGYLFRGSVSAPVPAKKIKSLSGGVKTYSDEQRQLYKHTASVGMYLGDVADSEPAITKKVTLSNRGYTSYNVTGVYAPAGEVLTVKLSGAAMNSTGGIAVNIGQALYNSQANNIWAGKNAMPRMPHVLTTLVMNKNTMTYNEETDTWTGYIGSFLGGPVYIQNESATYTVEISGGVTYSHFILGYTTPEEFEKNNKSTAPYFDLEVWEYGVLHSGPKRYAQQFSYNDLYNAAVYWEKVSLVTTQRGNGYKQGIVFIYDPFVAAGAAVAFPGRSSVNCPLGWMTSSLNYNSMITSGSWGNMHEYHHNFQGFGVGGGADGEVTNNSLNLVSYALFTNISARRGIGSFGAAGVGGGWNNYTVGTWTLNQINNKSISSTNGLAVYATLLHNFGPEAFIKNAKGSNGTYWNNWSNYTGYDMSYYANLVSTYAVSGATANPARPMFIPVSSVYQTGRSYGTGDNKKYITTTRPYVIPYGTKFNIDLSPYSAPSGQYASGSIVLPTKQDSAQTKRFSYTVKNVSQPEHGKIEKVDDLHYNYIPNQSDRSFTSGKIIVTLEITDDAGEITNIDDVDLVLEFEQTHEMNKMTLDRTTYTYDADKMYTDAVDAYNAGFKNYNSVVTEAQYNPVQNVNTDIWFRPDTEQYRTQFSNDPEKYFIHENQIDIVDGKLYCAEDGKYRIFLRGRTNCALYFSIDGKDYKLGATIKSATATDAPKGWANSQFRTFDSNTYFDVEFDEGACTVTVYVDKQKTYNYKLKRDETGEFRNWVYIKEILIDTSKGAVSYIGVGSAQWTETMFNLSETYHNASGGQLTSAENVDYSYTQNTYNNQSGVAIAATRTYANGSVKYYSISKGNYTEITGSKFAEITEPKLVEPTSAAYANAYRTTYEFRKNEFKSDYFYIRNYAANYLDNVNLTPASDVTLIDNNYSAPPTGWGWGNFPIANITDGNTNTYIHTRSTITESSPLQLTFDAGKEITANRIVITARNHNNMGEGPGSFRLLSSLDGVVYYEVASYENLPRANTTSVNFPETKFRYYRIIITHSQPTAGGGTSPYYIVISSISLVYSTEVTGGALYSPDNKMFTYNGVWSQAATHSNFGHVFIGKKGATIDFSFEGTQLGIVSSNSYGQKFEVYIDGKKAESLSLKEDKGTYKYTYISQKLKSGKHKVQIKCTGEANFDSFAVFNHPEKTD